jgi:serine/threonine protein kinase
VTLSPAQLWDKLVSSQLASAETCRQWALAVAESNPQGLHDTAKLLASLIQLGKLTPFQANVLYRGLPVALQLGPYRIERSMEAELGPDWFSAIDIASSSKLRPWIYVMASDRLSDSEIRSNPPSLAWANKHLAVTHPSLERWLKIDTQQHHLVAVVEPQSGIALATNLAEHPMNPRQAEAMVLQLAEGLRTLHAASLVHGHVHLHSIWQIEDGKFALRRDPLFPPTNPWGTASHSIIQASHEDRMGTAAPEWTLPGTVATTATDLYALGCVWYRCLSGRYPFAEKANGDPSVWAQRHASDKLNDPTLELLDDRARRCLSHLLAKNPSARFRSAADLITALQAPGRRMPKTQTSTPAIVPVEVVRAPIAKPVLASSSAVVSPSVSLDAVPKTIVSKKKVKRGKPVWLLPSMGVAGIGVIGILIALLLNKGGDEPIDASIARTNAERTEVVTNNNANSAKGGNVANAPPNVSPVDPNEKATELLSEYYSISNDDGKLLWAPPTVGRPFSLEMLPAGPETIVFLSGNAWHGKGKFAALRKWWLDASPGLRSHLNGIPLISEWDVESVAIAIYPKTVAGEPEAVYRLTLATPQSIDVLLPKLAQFKQQRLPGNSSQEKGYWIQAGGDLPGSMAVALDGMQISGENKVRRLTIGASSLVESMAELQGPAPVRRQMELLLASTDSRADVTLLAAPSFLFGDGRALLASVPQVVSSLRTVLDESIQAASITTKIEPTWYLEVRMQSSETRELGKLLNGLKSSLEKLPETVEKGLLNGNTHPYWRAIALRFPQMLRTLNRYLRFGLEDGQLIANAYLPSDAVDNVVIGSWMAWKDPVASAGNIAITSPSTTLVPAEKTIEEILESNISIAFEQESLESALQSIASEAGESIAGGKSVSMTINYDAFKKDGITQNQQIRNFQKRSVAVRSILTDLVRLANPVTTVQSPTESDQKVVWVVRDQQDGFKGKRIELTTRAWCEANAQQLPKEFVPD